MGAVRAKWVRCPELWLFACLSACALISGARFEDDSYGHYARSLLQIQGADYTTWITDVWNRPLPGLVYGLGSYAGLGGARVCAAGLALGAAHLTARVTERILPADVRPSRAMLLLGYFSQPAVLRDSFVTMTELPAAFFVAASLFFLI
ncbi:MAG TPA: hypothetical protein VGC79_33110, partial [Polyangiaceae bacterium]